MVLGLIVLHIAKSQCAAKSYNNFVIFADSCAQVKSAMHASKVPQDYQQAISTVIS